MLIFIVLSLITASLLYYCKPSDGDSPINTTPYQFPNIFWFPTKMNIPSDNPTTVEGVRLGRYLFYDGRWPGRFACDSQMSCGTCHLQSRGMECGIDHPKYIGGHPFGVAGPSKPSPHFMMALVNLVYHYNGYLWNGAVFNENPALGSAKYGVPAIMPFHMRNIETLVWMGLYAPHEMGSDTTKALAALRSITSPNYPVLFEAAFGTKEINTERIMKAIAQFIRTLVSYNSKYDSVVHLHMKRFTPSESRGYELFMTEKGDCFHCHGEPSLLTTNLYYNNGLDTIFNDVRDRYSISKDTLDKGAYKSPTLRNIALTGPYMRNGIFSTLEEVIEYYSTKVNKTPYTHPLMKKAALGGTQFTEGQKEDLLAFLHTLTDYKFISDTAFAKPSDLNTGCP